MVPLIGDSDLYEQRNQTVLPPPSTTAASASATSRLGPIGQALLDCVTFERLSWFESDYSVIPDSNTAALWDTLDVSRDGHLILC